MTKQKSIIRAAILVLIVVLTLLSVLAVRNLEQKRTAFGEPVAGVFQFEETLYMVPFSSFLAVKESMSHFVYLIEQDELRIIDTVYKHIEHYKFSGGTQDLTSQDITDKLKMPDFTSRLQLSSYKNISRQASYRNQRNSTDIYEIYRADQEIWLVRFVNDYIFSIYRLEEKSDTDISSQEGILKTKKSDDTLYGGTFTIAQHLHRFRLNGESFEPDDKFMYQVGEPYNLSNASVFFSMDAILQQLESIGRLDLAEQIRQTADLDYVMESIDGHNYIRAIDLKPYLDVFIGWELSSHTPVDFTTKDYKP